MRNNPLSPLDWIMAYKVSEAIFYLTEKGHLDTFAAEDSLPGFLALDGLSGDAALALEKILCAAGLFIRHEAGLSLSPEFRKILPFLPMERQLRDWHQRHDSLEYALSGGSPRDPLDHIEDPAFFDHYVRAMTLNADMLCLNLLRFCRPFSAKNILDLGGANGSFAAALLHRLPDCHITILDRPAMAAHVQHTADQHNLNGSMEFIAGDVKHLENHHDVIRKSDLITLMNILHLFPGEVIKKILKQLYNHMDPGHQICLFDHFLDPSADFNTSHLLAFDWINCASNFTLSPNEIIIILTDHGFTDCHHHLTAQGSFICGIKAS